MSDLASTRAVERPGSGESGGLLRQVVLPVAVGVVVLLASQGTQVLMPAARLTDGWSLGVRLVGVLMVAVGVMGLLRERARLPGRAPGRGDPTVVALRTVGTVMAVVALLGLFNPPPPSPSVRRTGIGFGLIEVSPFGGAGGGAERAPSRSRGGESVIRGQRGGGGDSPPLITTMEGRESPFVVRAMGLMSRVFLFLGVLLAVRYLMRKPRGRRHEEWEMEPPVAPRDAFAGLEASLEEIRRTEPEPRGAITIAYARLLEALAAAGAPRAAYEAPHEHLHRVLVPLGIRRDPLHGLARLYVLAQFGDRPVTEGHRQEAADALSASLADLKATGRRRGGVRFGTAPMRA